LDLGGDTVMAPSTNKRTSARAPWADGCIRKDGQTPFCYGGAESYVVGFGEMKQAVKGCLQEIAEVERSSCNPLFKRVTAKT